MYGGACICILVIDNCTGSNALTKKEYDLSVNSIMAYILLTLSNRILECTYIYTYLCVYIYIYIYINIYVYTHVCIYTYVCIHTRINMHVRMHICYMKYYTC